MRSLKLVCLTSLLGVVACGPKVASIEVSPATVEITKPGDTVALSAVPKDAAGLKVPNVVLSFASSDPAVATVDAASGKVTGLKTGAAKITVAFEKVVAEVPVVVSIPASLAVAPTALNLQVGARANVVARVLDEKGQEVKVHVSWASADLKVATVVNGEIAAVAKGEAQVIAVYGALRAAVAVTVAPVEGDSLEVEEKTLTLKVGATAQLKVVAKDPKGNVLRDPALGFGVGDPKIASVDGTGTVTGLAKGTTRVSIASGDRTASVELTVTKK